MNDVFINRDQRMLPDGTFIAFFPVIEKALIQLDHTSKMIDANSIEEAEAFYYQLTPEVMYG